MFFIKVKSKHIVVYALKTHFYLNLSKTVFPLFVCCCCFMFKPNTIINSAINFCITPILLKGNTVLLTKLVTFLQQLLCGHLCVYKSIIQEYLDRILGIPKTSVCSLIRCKVTEPDSQVSQI